MILYFLADGSYTISRGNTRRQREDRMLGYEAVRIVEIRDDGSIVVVKDRYSARLGAILEALPVGRMQA